MLVPEPVDPFNLAILGAVLLASFAPSRGATATTLEHVSVAAVALLFFFQGAKLSRSAILDGLRHTRLHAVVFALTFLIFPMLAWLLQPLSVGLLGAELAQGVLFMSALPATIQSAVVFTSIAGGNVAAAVCSASLSSILGVLLTPLILRLLAVGDAGQGISWTSLRDLGLQLVLPLILGQLARGLRHRGTSLGEWTERRRNALRVYDQSTIVLLVYVAFSHAVVEGLWSLLSPARLGGLLLINALLLALVMLLAVYGSRWLGFSRADEITILFCGSKKSLANGVPLAGVLFSSAQAGILVLPIMLFHQIQLMVCAALAKRYARATLAEAGDSANE